MSNSSMNRREFLQLTAGAAAMLGLTGCAQIKINPFARPRRPRPIAPGAKIRIAQIGFGGQGGHDVRQFAEEEIVALCDVDWSNGGVQGTFKQFPNAKRYKDFRKMLLEMDEQIDGVVISTPDHMHFLPAAMAMMMGKHVYVQKPLTQTIWEARELLKLARRHQVCTQMGNQGHATEAPKQVAEWIRGDVIGDVKEVHIWTNRPIWPQGMKERPKAEQPKKEMDWDLWLGRAAERPFNHAYHTFRWRGWLDFGTGALGDMGCHSIDAPFNAMELGAPTSIIAETSGLTAEAYPDWSIVTYEFPARGQWPAVTLKWYDGMKGPDQPNQPPRPRELEEGRKMNRSGQLYYGTKGVMLSQAESASGIRLIPESFMKEMQGKLPEKNLPRVPGENHYKEWATAIRKGNPKGTGTQFGFAVPLTEIVLLGNIALRVPGQKIQWDGKAMKITSHPELNKYIKPDFRKGWEPEALPV